MYAVRRGGLPVTLLLLLSLVQTDASAAEDIAPGLADDAVEEEASDALRELVGTLDAREQEALQGIYVAFEPSRTEVLALPACDDDGDYVIVLSHALLDLVQHVAYADASDRLRGTHLLGAYGPFLARAQRRDARLLPPPPPPPSPRRLTEREEARAHAAVGEVAHAFLADALSWLVADELAHAVAGDFVCPSPTRAHEHGDDVWTVEERTRADALAPSRMTHVAAADVWATTRVLGRGGSEVPALELLRALAPLEEARPPREASTYLTLHPGARARAAALESTARVWRDAQAAARERAEEGAREGAGDCESSAGGPGMR